MKCRRTRAAQHQSRHAGTKWNEWTSEFLRMQHISRMHAQHRQQNSLHRLTMHITHQSLVGGRPAHCIGWQCESSLKALRRALDGEYKP